MKLTGDDPLDLRPEHPPGVREVIAERVYRMGRQTVERDGDRFFLTISNRTYHSEVEVPTATAYRFWRKMTEDAIRCDPGWTPRR